MALILNIDTSESLASVSLAREGKIIGSFHNSEQHDHAAWLHVAIKNMLNECGLPIKQLEAIAVNKGPGSYTGLRVGLSAAKGLCYALGLPLVAVGGLKIHAHAATQKTGEGASLFCPMIDARRMEVFTAIYDRELTEIKKPGSLVLTAESVGELTGGRPLIFCGSGSEKLKTIIFPDNATYVDSYPIIESLSYLSDQFFMEKIFADTVYSEPLYIKDFFTPDRKPPV